MAIRSSDIASISQQFDTFQVFTKIVVDEIRKFQLQLEKMKSRFRFAQNQVTDFLLASIYFMFKQWGSML